MKLLKNLLAHIAGPGQETSQTEGCTAGARPRDAETSGRCCGWFDSSHELCAGLCVVEHASPDTLAAELPLGSWLELHLSGWQAAPAP